MGDHEQTTISHDQFQEAVGLDRAIQAAYEAAKDARDELNSLVIRERVSEEYRESCLRASDAGFAELNRLVSEELLPKIRLIVPDYSNPFPPDEPEPGEEIPF